MSDPPILNNTLTHILDDSIYKQSSWVHGNSIQAEESSWNVKRRGLFSHVRPSTSNRRSWIHFAIPSPVIINDRGVKAQSATVRLRTGSQAHIVSFYVYDGEKKILNVNDIRITCPTMLDIRQVIPGTPEVFYGTGVTLGVQFDGGPDAAGAWVDFVSAGVDYVYRDGGKP